MSEKLRLENVGKSYRSGESDLQVLQGAELTLHVRLLEGRDTQHVLDSIFKALGVALGQACRPRGRKET